MRNKITEKLLELEPKVYYGMIPDNEEIEQWNYFVFGQEKISKGGTSLTDLQGYWYVTIVREDFIPDETVLDVIDKMLSINGLRLADGDYEYNYVQKGSTNIIVEMLQLKFTKTKKRC